MKYLLIFGTIVLSTNTFAMSAQKAHKASLKGLKAAKQECKRRILRSIDEAVEIGKFNTEVSCSLEFINLQSYFEDLGYDVYTTDNLPGTIEFHINW